MIGALKGVKEMQKVLEESKKASQGGGKRESDFLKLTDGQSTNLLFLQELDESGKNFREENGLAITVFEHRSPNAPFRRFLCTINQEGKCVGCERIAVAKAWKKRPRLYVNAYSKELDKVVIVTSGFSNRGIAETMLEFFNDFETVCDRYYKYRRDGEKLQTSYTIYPKDLATPDWDNMKVHDLSAFAKYRTYDEVVELLGDGQDNEASTDW